MERIGLLFVHGIGEQRVFQHLSSEVQHLVDELLRNTARYTDVTVDLRTLRSGEVGAEALTWHADQGSPVRVYFCVKGDPTPKCLECHEVWWADLDNDDSFWNQVRLWAWGLGRWAAPKREPTDADLERLKLMGLRPPTLLPGRLKRFARVRLPLFVLGCFVFLALFSVSLLNLVLERVFGRRLRLAKLMYQYLSDVQLYQQQVWSRSAPPLTDLVHPPRVSIRRRVVSALVHMYM